MAETKRKKSKKGKKGKKRNNMAAMRQANADALMFRMISRGFGGGLGSSGSPFNQTYLLNQNIQQLGRDLKSELAKQQGILEREREKRKEIKPELDDIKQNLYQNAVFTGKMLNDFYNQQNSMQVMQGSDVPTIEEIEDIDDRDRNLEEGPSMPQAPQRPKRKTPKELEQQRQRELEALKKQIQDSLTPKKTRRGKRY